MVLPKFRLILPKNFSIPPEEIVFSLQAIWEFLPKNLDLEVEARSSLPRGHTFAEACYDEFKKRADLFCDEQTRSLCIGETSDDALASHCDYFAELRLLAEEYLEALSS